MSEAVRTWSDFIKKLENAKTYNVKGLQAPSICTLIYSGALDSLIGGMPLNEKTLDRYAQMFEEVKKATRSKASVPKKKKSDYIGLDEVSNLVELELWRNQSSPIYRFSVADYYKKQLSMDGFKPFDNPAYPIIKMIYEDSDRTKNKILIEKWNDIFLPENAFLFNFAANRERELYIIGYVKETETRSYGENKDKSMFKVSVFTGQQEATGLVLWQDRETGLFDTKMKKDLSVGNVCLIKVTPSIRGSFRGGSINSTKVL